MTVMTVRKVLVVVLMIVMDMVFALMECVSVIWDMIYHTVLMLQCVVLNHYLIVLQQIQSFLIWNALVMVFVIMDHVYAVLDLMGLTVIKWHRNLIVRITVLITEYVNMEGVSVCAVIKAMIAQQLLASVLTTTALDKVNVGLTNAIVILAHLEIDAKLVVVRWNVPKNVVYVYLENVFVSLAGQEHPVAKR